MWSPCILTLRVIIISCSSKKLKWSLYERFWAPIKCFSSSMRNDLSHALPTYSIVDSHDRPFFIACFIAKPTKHLYMCSLQTFKSNEIWKLFHWQPFFTSLSHSIFFQSQVYKFRQKWHNTFLDNCLVVTLTPKNSIFTFDCSNLHGNNLVMTALLHPPLM